MTATSNHDFKDEDEDLADRRHGPKMVSKTWSIPSYTALFAVIIILVPWSRRWLASGCAFETLLLLIGESNGTRILPGVPTYALVAVLNLVYAICTTSWLLYGLLTALIWPCTIITCMYQFHVIANFTRSRLRRLLKQHQVTHDTIAFFNIPALEIDTDVAGLMVIRALTISFSTLTIVAHGIELGLKLTEDIEVAIHTDKVTIALFRSINIGDCFANIKGGKEEMTFAELGEDTTDDDAIFVADTPLLRSASGKDGKLKPPRPPIIKKMTGGKVLDDTTARQSLQSLKRISPDDDDAHARYTETLEHIYTSSASFQARTEVEAQLRQDMDEPDVELDENDVRANVCAKMHGSATVPHPPKRSIRVTTLQQLSPPYVRRFLHRLPLLLRLLLAPLAYLHTINIASITAAGSGQWLRNIIHAEVFKHYVNQNAELRRLARRMEGWLAQAHFVVALVGVDAQAQVPVLPNYDITTEIRFRDVQAYRTGAESTDVKQVLRLGGADAAFIIPSFLLPHHEHLIPARPTEEMLAAFEAEVENADGVPKTVQKQGELDVVKKDEALLTMRIHISLPATFDQDLLNFIAAFVKAEKVIEIEKTADEALSDYANSARSPVGVTDEAASITDDGTTSERSASPSKASQRMSRFVDSVKQTTREGLRTTKDSVKVAFVGGIINDRWIARMVGKIAAKLENAQGDLGYSGTIPVQLEPYRTGFNTNTETKLLP